MLLLLKSCSIGFLHRRCHSFVGPGNNTGLGLRATDSTVVDTNVLRSSYLHKHPEDFLLNYSVLFDLLAAVRAVYVHYFIRCYLQFYICSITGVNIQPLYKLGNNILTGV